MRTALASAHVSLFCLMAMTAPALAIAADGDYRIPAGFNGHVWNEPLTAFPDIRLLIPNTAINATGKTAHLQVDCTTIPDADGNCPDPYITQDIDGAGSYALGEYYFESDRNPWAAAQVQLGAITYLFCDKWHGLSVPRDMKEQLRSCGNRVVYSSDTAQQLEKKPAGYRSNHERLLKYLIGEYGLPDGYRLKKGVVLVGPIGQDEDEDEDTLEPTVPGQPDQAAPQKLLRHTWCGLPQQSKEIASTCSASITLVFDRDRGAGMVLFATRPVYEYAYARYSMGDTNNGLHLLLTGLAPSPPSLRHKPKCTGTLICRNSRSAMTAEQVESFRP